MEKMLENSNMLALDKSANVNQSIIESMTLEGVQKTLNKINAFHAIVKASLIPEIDYGIIPGTTKTILFKSGAENILMLFGLATAIDVVSAIPEQLNRDTNFVSFTVKCRLLKDGIVMSEGIGTCNSGERKYIKNEALDIANTILKMAGKRALMDAVLHVASLSAVFASENEEVAEYLNREAMDNLGVDEASRYKITFGKHKGKTCGEIYKEDYSYVQWFETSGRDEKVKKAFEVLSEAVRISKEKGAKREETKVEATEQAEKREPEDGSKEVDLGECIFGS